MDVGGDGEILETLAVAGASKGAIEAVEKAGGKVERLFGIDGLDNTAIDTCELYVQENGNSVNRSIVTPACEDMGRIASAANFIEAIEGRAKPLNTPEQAYRLMQVIDAIYASAKTGKPVSL